MGMKEPHELLGLPADATMGEIKQAYKQMALKWHPDRHIHDNNKDHAISMFAQVTNAYQLLMRDLDPPPVSTKSKLHARPPTPVPSCRSSTESPTSTSSNTPSRLSTSFHSDDSQTILPSSFRGSEADPNFKPFNRYLDHSFDSPISISNELSSQETNGSDMPEDTLRPNPPRTFLGRRHPACFANNNVQSVNAGWNAHVGRLKPPPSHPIRVPMAIKFFNGGADTQLLRPGPPLYSIGLGTSGEWAYSLTLTLEELFAGKHCRFCVVRRFLSGRLKSVVIELVVPSGCQRGTRILCRGVGHELPSGKLQDVAFVIEQAPHSRFSRIRDDLFLDIRMPWMDSFERRPKEVCIKGIDGEEISVFIDFLRDKLFKGNLSVRGAGMPVREGGRVRGRGNLVVRWEIQPPTTHVRQFWDRFLHPTRRTKRAVVAHYT